MNVLISQIGAEEAEASGIAALGFDVKAFLVQLITFLIVLYILKRFVFGRVVDLLEKRRLTIEEGVKLTAEMKAAQEKLEKQIADEHRKAREEADKLLTAAQDQAHVMIRDAQDAAQAKVDAMLEDAKKKIGDETQRAKRALEKETVELIIQATEVIAREKLDSKKDSRLIAEALGGRR